MNRIGRRISLLNEKSNAQSCAAVREPDGIRHMRSADRVMRRDGVLGAVVAVSLLYAVVAWEDGSVVELEQDSADVWVWERSEIGAIVAGVTVDQLRDEIYKLRSERNRKEIQVEDLQDEIEDLDDQIAPLEDALRAMGQTVMS